MHQREEDMNCNNKIRIIFFICDLGGGGAERVVLNILRTIDRNRFEPILYLFTRGGSLLPMVPPDIEIYSFDEFKIPKLYGIRFIIFFKKFVNHMRKLNPNIMLSFMWYPNAIAIIAGKLYGRGVRTIASERTSTSAYSSRLDDFLRSSVIKYLYPRADLIVSPSLGIANALTSKGVCNKNIKVIHNPVDISLIQDQAKEYVANPWFNGNSNTLLGVGRLGNEKGFDYLLKAISILKKDHIDCKLVLVGEGKERLSLEKLIAELGVQDVVQLVGFQENPYKYLARATVFVLSSLYEGFPNVLLEAMALGIPSVASRCPTGPEEIITDGVDGLLVPPADAEALAKAIRRLLLDESLRKRLGEAGRKRAEDFAAEKIVKQYEDVIEQTCAQKDVLT
jgi:glycosyltransferase involved in cell wall biosynthesis